MHAPSHTYCGAALHPSNFSYGNLCAHYHQRRGQAHNISPPVIIFILILIVVFLRFHLAPFVSSSSSPLMVSRTSSFLVQILQLYICGFFRGLVSCYRPSCADLSIVPHPYLLLVFVLVRTLISLVLPSRRPASRLSSPFVDCDRYVVLSCYIHYIYTCAYTCVVLWQC